MDINENHLKLISIACHEVNRAWCVAHNDLSQPPYEELDDEAKASSLAGVRGVLEDDNTPEQSHQSWLAFKRAHGWTYGPVKDPERKLHPCMVAYDDLPHQQKYKDHLFVNTVRQMALGLQLLK